MAYEWQFNTETGAFKNHSLSRDLYQAAVENAIFMDHVKPVKGFGKKMGESVLLTRITRLTEPSSVALNEGARIPEDDYAMTTRSITVTEIGRSVPYSSLAEDLTWYDLENSVQKVLMEQMQLGLDSMAASTTNGFRAGSIKYQLTGLTAGTFTTNGSFGGASAVNLNMYHVEQIRDYMFDTLFVPEVSGGGYTAICRTLGLRGLKRDSDWAEWHKYTDPSAKWNNEVGQVEGIRFIECNHNNALGQVGTGSVLGESVFFGDDAVALAEVQTPELRAAMPDDFGRSKAVAWYGILQFGVIWNTGNAGQAKIVHVGST